MLIRIKRAVLAGNYAFSEKADSEMYRDGLTEDDVVESIVNAVAVYKILRSTSHRRSSRRENLYIIQSTNLDGMVVNTKGKFVRESGVDMYYFLISAKKAQ